MRLAPCLLALALAGCAHAAPTAPVAAAQAWSPNCHPWTGPCVLPSTNPKPWSAFSAQATIAHATKLGVDKPIIQNYTITLDGSLSLKLTYAWKPWMGQGFTSAVLDGKPVTPDTASASADRIALATLQPGVDAQIVRRAVELLRDLAGV